MLDLSDLYQFVTYADCGTLSAAADKLHISQPTLTRTMHDVEDAFGVPLFHRSKNRIERNRIGRKRKPISRVYRILIVITAHKEMTEHYQQDSTYYIYMSVHSDDYKDII